MAQFSISMKNQRGLTTLTDYDSLANKTAGLTFDEQLELNVDGSTLSFSMIKYLYEASNKVINTAAVSITYGTIIQLLTNNHRYDFAVTDINYQFMAENVQLSFTSQDLFQFECARLGVGYTITSDTTDPEYLGARSIDYWGLKIVQDNNLNWSYVPIDTLNHDILINYVSQHINDVRADITEDVRVWLDLPKDEYSTLNSYVSFECSNSNAYNALKQLANDNELFIWVDYTTRSFGFVPLKSPVFNGYYFNPYNNLQQFSLRGSGGNLITVLNVTGPQDVNNQEITLMPTVPVDVAAYINTDDWLNSKYYTGLYDSITSDEIFKQQIQYTPWFENKLIDISFFVDSNILLKSEQTEIESILNNDLRIANGLMTVGWTAYIQEYEKDYMRINEAEIELESVCAELYSDINTLSSYLSDDIYNYTPIFIAYEDTGNKYVGVSFPTNYHVNIEIGDHTYLNVLTNGSIDNDYFKVHIPTPTFYPDNVSGTYSYKTTAGITTINQDIIPSIINNQINFGIQATWYNTTTNNPQQYWGLNLKVTTDDNSPWLYTNGSHTVEGQGTFSSLCSHSYVSLLINDEVARYNISLDPGPYFLYQYNGNYFWSKTLPDHGELVDLTDGHITTLRNTTLSIKGRQQSGEDIRPVQGTVTLQLSTQFITPISYDIHSITIKWINWVWDTGYVPDFPSPYTFTLPVTSLNIHPFQGPSVTINYQNQYSARIKYNVNTVSIKNNSDYAVLAYYGSLILPNSNYVADMDDQIYYWAINSPTLNPTLIIKKGPMTIKPYIIVNEWNGETWVETQEWKDQIKVQENDTSYALQSIYNAQVWSPELLKSNTAGLHEHFNTYAARYQNSYNLLLENLYQFQKYWKQPISSRLPTMSIGQFYATYRKIGVVASDPILTNSSPWSTAISTHLTTNDINILNSALLTTDEPIQRSKAIQLCASIAAQLTEYWNIAYTCASQLNIYLPQSWDCLDILETEYTDNQQACLFVLALYPASDNFYTDLHWNSAPSLNSWIIPEIVQSELMYPNTYKFQDDNNSIAIDQNTVPIINNTDDYYTLTTSINNQQYPYYALIYNVHNAGDNIHLYESCNRVKQYTYSLVPNHGQFRTTVESIAQFINVPVNINATNPLERFLTLLASSTQYDLTQYYLALQDHNNIWHTLYYKYPGIFRESEYSDTTANSSAELYHSARRQLNQLSHPEFSYNLTGMDIYMYNSDFLPTKIQLGEQIRIDYQESDQITDTLNAALREPLFITGISHTLRNDGNYQFTVVTRMATDRMIQRFAQLLNFGK